MKPASVPTVTTPRIILDAACRRRGACATGQAVFERDAVTFDHAADNNPLLAALAARRMPAGRSPARARFAIVGSTYFPVPRLFT